MLYKPSWKKIDKLLDKNFIFEYFSENIKKIDPEANQLKKAVLYPIKNHKGAVNRHVVVFYSLSYLINDRDAAKKKIIVSAHSSGSRKQTYQIMKNIYNHGFNTKGFAIPKPLFYDPAHKALFYVAAEGSNLYSYIRKRNWRVFRKNSIKVAAWLARFHELSIRSLGLKTNCLSKASIDPTSLLNKKNEAARQYKKTLLALHSKIKKLEPKIIDRKRLGIIHGDLHPENVIVNKDKKNITIIDFTETKKGDPAYDIASFIQQIEAMSQGYFRKKQVRKLQNDFIEMYYSRRRFKPVQDDRNRIHLYMAWVALRGAIYFINSDNLKKIDEFIRECNYYLDKIKI